MAENITRVIISNNKISYVISAEAGMRENWGLKKKGGPRGAAPKCKSRFEAGYMPEPWIPFQLASIAFTALSGSGT
jgi:hypothetical protein